MMRHPAHEDSFKIPRQRRRGSRSWGYDSSGPGGAADRQGLLPVIIQLRTPNGPPARAANNQAAANALGLLRQNGKAGSALGIVSGASGRLNAAAIRALANNPNVAAIYEDVVFRRKA